MSILVVGGTRRRRYLRLPLRERCDPGVPFNDRCGLRSYSCTSCCTQHTAVPIRDTVACFPRPGTSTVRVYKYEKWHFSTFFSSKNDFSTICKNEKPFIACFRSSLFFVIIKRDFITDYLNVPAFSQNFWFELQITFKLYHFVTFSYSPPRAPSHKRSTVFLDKCFPVKLRRAFQTVLQRVACLLDVEIR